MINPPDLADRTIVNDVGLTGNYIGICLSGKSTILKQLRLAIKITMDEMVGVQPMLPSESYIVSIQSSR